MRVWIAYLISQPNAKADFEAYIYEVKKSLSEAQNAAILENRYADAAGIAHEIKVYEDLRKVVQREVREQHAQTDYLNSIEGG